MNTQTKWTLSRNGFSISRGVYRATLRWSGGVPPEEPAKVLREFALAPEMAEALQSLLTASSIIEGDAKTGWKVMENSSVPSLRLWQDKASALLARLEGGK